MTGPLSGEASLRRLFAEEQALSRNVLRENERLKHELSILEVGWFVEVVLEVVGHPTVISLNSDSFLGGMKAMHMYGNFGD